MRTTSVTLFDRLKRARPDDRDWAELRDLYVPLIESWLARVPGLGDGAADVAQEVFIVMGRAAPGFDRRRQGSFRAWLREVMVRQIKKHRRERARHLGGAPAPIDGFLDQIADPGGSLAREWDRQHDRHVAAKLLATVRPDFSPPTWEAFRRFCLDGEPAGAVAAALGLSENAVILAKHRVLRRLREAAGGILD